MENQEKTVIKKRFEKERAIEILEEIKERICGVDIDDDDCVKISYPNFFEELKSTTHD